MWQASLERTWSLFKASITGPLLPQIPFQEAIGFGEALGTAEADEEAILAIKANPNAASTFLLFATQLDKHFEKNPEQMFDLSLSKRGGEIGPFQILASATMDTMQRVIEREKQPPPRK